MFKDGSSLLGGLSPSRDVHKLGDGEGRTEEQKEEDLKPPELKDMIKNKA